MGNVLILISSFLALTSQIGIGGLPHRDGLSVDWIMQNRLPSFVSEYNSASNENLEATKLLEIVPLSYPYGSKLYAFDVGYAVIDDSGEVYGISNDIVDEDVLAYKPLAYSQGHFYHNEEGFWSLLSCDQSFTVGSNYSSDNDRLNADYGYALNIGEYVSQKYPGYQFVDSNSIHSYTHSYMCDTSFYNLVHKYRGVYSGEANCALNAAYSFLYNIGKKGFYTNYYEKNEFIDVSDQVENDKIKGILDIKEYEADGKPLSYYEIRNNSRFGNPYFGYDNFKKYPSLYKDIRDYAIDYLGYDGTNGININCMSELITNTDYLYGYRFQFLPNSDYTAAIESINRGYPSFVATAGTLLYQGGHSINVIGYYRVKKTTGWWIFSNTDYKVFWQVDDGILETDESCYFDPNLGGICQYYCVNYEKGVVVQ